MLAFPFFWAVRFWNAEFNGDFLSIEKVKKFRKIHAKKLSTHLIEKWIFWLDWYFMEKLSAYNWFELSIEFCVIWYPQWILFAIMKQNPVHETVKAPNAFINVSLYFILQTISGLGGSILSKKRYPNVEAWKVLAGCPRPLRVAKFNFKTHFKKMFSRLFESFRARLASKLSIKKWWKNKVFTFITVWKKLSAFLW